MTATATAVLRHGERRQTYDHGDGVTVTAIGDFDDDDGDGDGDLTTAIL
jgi:hypothetical protein